MTSQDEFQYQIFQNNQDMIKFADSKSSMALTIVSIMLPIVLSSSIYSNVYDKIKEIDRWEITAIFTLSFLSFLILSALTIFFSISVFKARSGDANEHEGVIYFGHIAKFTSVADYEKKVNEIGPNGIVKEYIKQNYIISKIAYNKMKNVNEAIFFLVSTIIATIIFFVIESYIYIL